VQFDKTVISQSKVFFGLFFTLTWLIAKCQLQASDFQRTDKTSHPSGLPHHNAFRTGNQLRRSTSWQRCAQTLFVFAQYGREG